MKAFIIRQLFLVIICSSLSLFSLERLKAARLELSLAEQDSYEVLYLPSIKALSFASFGYKNFLADLLWFKTISYFGKHHKRDQNYPWLKHICSLVTKLDPGARHVYEFGALILAWEANQPHESIALLDQAILDHPEYWKFWYLRGFNRMYFLSDTEGAASDFVKAAKLKDAPPMVASLAAKKLALNDGNPEHARDFLRDMIEQTQDPVARNALVQRYKEAQLEVEIQKIERAAQLFQERYQRKASKISELFNAGLLGSIEKDPFGGRYFIDSESFEVKSSSKRKRFKLYQPKKQL
jgi:tetratricopeptide (TPR) repeat protein